MKIVSKHSDLTTTKMFRTARFADAFWETDYNGTLGFDLLCKRVREGQKSCKDIEDFFRKRSKIESHYGKDLKSLATMTEGRDEISDLGVSWLELRLQTEKVAQLHETSSLEYNALADEVARFLEIIKFESKQYEDKVKDKQKTKRAMHSKMQELQKAYFEKCREYILLEGHYDATRQSLTTSVREIERCRIKAERSRDAMEKSDQLFTHSLDALERLRQTWESSMEEVCEMFQREEEDRIILLRDMMWKCTNIDSQLCLDWDQCNDMVRLFLEKCNVNKDIADFINHNRTGSRRPVPIEYESYFADTRENRSPGMTRRKILPLPFAPIPHLTLHPPERSPSPQRKQSYDYASVYSTID